MRTPPTRSASVALVATPGEAARADGGTAGAPGSAVGLPRSAAALLAAALLVAPRADALEFECSLPGDTRFLRIDLPGEERLCEVSVTGEGGAGERRVLWYADNDTLYCSAKLYELHDKYVEEFGFDCAAWPDRDGIDRLSARQRDILDLELKSLRERGRESEPRFEVSGVRAVASTPLDRRPGMLAMQFFTDEGDIVRLVADESASFSVLGDVGDLAARVDPIDGLEVSGAFIDAVSDGGAIEVLTLLSPDGSGEGPAPCEGRQTLRLDADGALVPSTPHRHVCSVDVVPDGG